MILSNLHFRQYGQLYVIWMCYVQMAGIENKCILNFFVMQIVMYIIKYVAQYQLI